MPAPYRGLSDSTCVLSGLDGYTGRLQRQTDAVFSPLTSSTGPLGRPTGQAWHGVEGWEIGPHESLSWNP